MQNISLRSSGMRKKKHLGFKSDSSVLTFLFSISLLPSSFDLSLEHLTEDAAQN